MVAFTMLCGLFDPSDFVRMSFTPATSSTARTAPPAMTPVPGEAGFMSTREAPNIPITWYGIVAALHRDAEHVLLGRFRRLANGVRDLVRLAEPDPDLAHAVTDGDESVEAEPAPSLDDLRDPVDMNRLFEKLGSHVRAAIPRRSGIPRSPAIPRISRVSRSSRISVV